MCSSGESNVVDGRGTPTVPLVIVVHRNHDVNASKVHCPKAGHHVEKQHYIMNRQAESAVGGTVGAHAKAHHHEAGAAQDEQTKCSTANTEQTTTVRTAYTLIRPPQHDTWPGKKTFYCLGLLYMPIYRPQHYIESLISLNEHHQRQMPIPRLLLMGRTYYDREHMAQSRGKRV